MCFVSQRETKIYISSWSNGIVDRPNFAGITAPYTEPPCCDEVIYVIRYLFWNVSYCFRSLEIFLLGRNDTSVWVNFFGTLTRFKFNFNRFSISSLNSGGLFCRRDSNEKQSWPQKTVHLLLPLTSSYFSNFQAKVVL